jgi:hypothetical protein
MIQNRSYGRQTRDHRFFVPSTPSPPSSVPPSQKYGFFKTLLRSILSLAVDFADMLILEQKSFCHAKPTKRINAQNERYKYQHENIVD